MKEEIGLNGFLVLINDWFKLFVKNFKLIALIAVIGGCIGAFYSNRSKAIRI